MNILAAIKREGRKLEKQLGKLNHQLSGVRAAAKALGGSAEREVAGVKKRVLSGIRISELLALEIGKHISADGAVINIRQQRGKWGGIESTPKTEAGFRDIDLWPSLAKMLRDYIGNRRDGFLFQTRSGKMLSPENLWRDGFATIMQKMGREGVRFHAFRRFREAVLQASECRELLIDYWMGHSNTGMGSRYAKQLVESRKFRAEWAEKVGLGFEVPMANILEPGLIALRALQNQESVVAA
jgi:integrase